MTEKEEKMDVNEEKDRQPKDEENARYKKLIDQIRSVIVDTPKTTAPPFEVEVAGSHKALHELHSAFTSLMTGSVVTMTAHVVTIILMMVCIVGSAYFFFKKCRSLRGGGVQGGADQDLGDLRQQLQDLQTSHRDSLSRLTSGLEFLREDVRHLARGARPRRPSKGPAEMNVNKPATGPGPAEMNVNKAPVEKNVAVEELINMNPLYDIPL